MMSKLRNSLCELCTALIFFCDAAMNRCNPFVQVRYGLITTESISMPMGAE